MKRLLLALAVCRCSVVHAQPYPNRPIKFVVPFPPGGNLDFVARSLQPKMQEVLGQPVVIDNKGGAAGMIGLEYAARQPAAAGLDVASSSPAEFAAFIRSEIAKWGRVAKEANIRLD